MNETSETRGAEYKLFVANIPFSSTPEELQEHFSRCGTVVDCKIVVDKGTGESRGFGFVTFSTEQAMQAGLDLDGSGLGGRTLAVKRAENKPRTSRRPLLVS